MRYALIENNVVTDIFELAQSAATTWITKAGTTLIQSSTANIDWIYDGTNFTPPMGTALSGRQIALNNITNLESSVTQRRIRDAILGTDNGWLKNVEEQIATIRSTL